MNYTQWPRTCVFSGHKSSPVRGLRGDRLDWRLGLHGLYILSWQRSGGRRTELLKNFLTQAHIQRGLGSEFILHVSSLVCLLSHVWLYPWTVAHQAPLSKEFPRQEYWSGLPFPSPGDLLNPGFEPASLALAGGFFTNCVTWEAPLHLWSLKNKQKNVYLHSVSFIRPSSSQPLLPEYLVLPSLHPILGA